MPPPVDLGRAIIFDGVDDYLDSADTGTAVPASQSGWRFMARLRGLGPGSGTGNNIFRDTSAAVLTLQHFDVGTFGRLYAYIGPAADGSGFVSIPSSDCIVLVRCNPSATEISLEIWDLNGSNRQAVQVTSASASATNFQNRILQVGSLNGTSAWFTGKADRMLFKTGAGTYNGTAPDVLAESADIFDWKFDADSGLDSTGHANLMVNGSPAFENTP